jgi:hypothetical protein
MQGSLQLLFQAPLRKSIGWDVDYQSGKIPVPNFLHEEE